MKKLKLIFIFVFFIIGIEGVNAAKDELMKCEYYKPYDQLGGSSQVAVLCNVYTDYSHKCYMAVGKNNATSKNNKEKIQNWGAAIGLSWQAKDYVKENKKCPDYLIIKMESGYELHAAATKEEAEALKASLYGTRHIATNINMKRDEETIKKAREYIDYAIKDMDSVSQNYSIESCMLSEKNITKYSECKKQISSLKSRMESYKDEVTNYLNLHYFDEKDDIIQSYRNSYDETTKFLEQADKELETRDKEIKEELGISSEESPNDNPEEIPNDDPEEPSKEYTDPNTEIPITDTSTGKLCRSDNLKVPLKYIGWLLTAAKIIIPVLVIIFGIIDFFKVITAGKPEEITKAIKSILMRIIAGVIIFFIPAIINFLFTLLDDFNDYKTSYSECTKCLSDPKSC